MLRRIDASQAIAAQAPELPDVRDIVERVKLGGDAAVRAVAQSLGDPSPRRVPPFECKAAFETIDAGVRTALLGAAERIEAFARLQRSSLRDVAVQVGTMELGHRAVPIRRAGIYVPGGRHSLPSCVLMGAIPARVAGVASVAMCTPRATPHSLAAAYVAGVDEVFEIGGAQAIAALAYGTESIDRVDVIAGPGNGYVTAAKRLVFGDCGIDSIAGPSEVLVVASDGADPVFVAADLLAQAEHDVDARAMLVTDDAAFADRVDFELARQLSDLPTSPTARIAIERNGWCALVPLSEAAALVNHIAPEHVSLHGAAESLESDLRAFGTLFVGSRAAEVFGDYGAGPNHVLPTAASARFTSGLSVLTFLTVRTYQRATEAIDAALVRQAQTLARIEGLEAHARAAVLRG